MIDRVLAGVGVLVCAVLLLRMAIGTARCNRLDAKVRGWFGRLSGRARAVRRRSAPLSVDAEAAQREAQRAIDRARRARTEAEHDGNVIRPRAFRGPKKKPPLH